MPLLDRRALLDQKVFICVAPKGVIISKIWILEGLGILTRLIVGHIKAARLSQHALLSRISLADVSQQEEECCERIEGQILLVRLCRNHVVRR
jgi:hypothetical protein